MVGSQTTLGADVFGRQLQERVARAEQIRVDAAELFRALNERRDGEWQPAVVDRASHYAAMAIFHAQDDVYDKYLALAKETLTAAQWQFEDVDR